MTKQSRFCAVVIALLPLAWPSPAAHAKDRDEDETYTHHCVSADRPFSYAELPAALVLAQRLRKKGAREAQVYDSREFLSQPYPQAGGLRVIAGIFDTRSEAIRLEGKLGKSLGVREDSCEPMPGGFRPVSRADDLRLGSSSSKAALDFDANGQPLSPGCFAHSPAQGRVACLLSNDTGGAAWLLTVLDVKRSLPLSKLLLDERRVTAKQWREVVAVLGPDYEPLPAAVVVRTDDDASSPDERFVVGLGRTRMDSGGPQRWGHHGGVWADSVFISNGKKGCSKNGCVVMCTVSGGSRQVLSETLSHPSTVTLGPGYVHTSFFNQHEDRWQLYPSPWVNAIALGPTHVLLEKHTPHLSGGSRRHRVAVQIVDLSALGDGSNKDASQSSSEPLRRALKAVD